MLINWNSPSTLPSLTLRANFHYKSINRFPGKLSRTALCCLVEGYDNPRERESASPSPYNCLCLSCTMTHRTSQSQSCFSTKSEKSNQVQTYLPLLLFLLLLLLLLLFVYCDDLLTNSRLIKTTQLFCNLPKRLAFRTSRPSFYLVNCSICLSDCMANVNPFSYCTYNCYNHGKYVCRLVE